MYTSITFISSFLEKKTEEEINDIFVNFSYLAMQNIHFSIYVSEENETRLRKFIEPYSNIKIIDVIDLSNTWISGICDLMENDLENPITLPDNRNLEKDTKEYILLGHTKHELILDAMEKNIWNSSHFAWIDFNIAHLFKTKAETGEYLRWLNRITLSESFITFPGCWSKVEKVEDILNSVHWRFCGCFFLGDMKSMTEFCLIYKDTIPLFLKEHRKLVWDFNYWAWMEIEMEKRKKEHEEKKKEDGADEIETDTNKSDEENLSFTPIWYRGDHNDSILISSADIYTRKLNLLNKVEYDYPSIDTYYATSASYLYYNDKHWLNTRYVNYWIYPTGCYLFHNDKKIIENKNMLSELDDDKLTPIFYKEVEETIDLPIHEGLSRGLEDVRLYECNGKVKYIATTMGYSPSGKSRMIVGDYDIENARICEGTVIESPDTNPDCWCEKNWIPIIKKITTIMGDGNIMEQDEELFIYKWSPIEIGKINYINKKLEIVYTHHVNMPIFSKIRGSTLFHETEAGLIGVVHYSEEHAPRHYYHMLVLLEKETYQIIRYTETFCFEKLGVEFCIGFTMREAGEGDNDKDEYVFWISRHDRDPAMITVEMDEIKWL
jgi:hypothetical protein